MASTGLPSLLASAGMRMGVSQGKSLSDTKKTDVLRTGIKVPVQAHLKRATAVVTITNYQNLISGGADTLQVGATTFTAQASAVTPGDATFQSASSNDATATSIATQINAHATAGAAVYAVASAAVVTLHAIVEGVGTGHDVAVVYNNLHGSAGIVLSGLDDGKLTGGSDDVDDIAYIVKGAKMYINRTTGKADIAMSGFSTVSDAMYVDGPKTGIKEDGTECAACVVDMQGGL
jgi:hypothetical protein